jgi:hypothetical protein
MKSYTQELRNLFLMSGMVKLCMKKLAGMLLSVAC